MDTRQVIARAHCLERESIAFVPRDNGNADRELPYRPLLGFNHVGIAPGIYRATVRPSRRKNRGIVLVACFHQAFKEPACSRRRRETWRSIAVDRPTACILYDELATANVLEEFPAALLEHEFMCVAMRCHFVSTCQRFSNQVRVSLRHPTEKETGYLSCGFIEQVQKPEEVHLDSGWQIIPLANAWRRRDLKNMEPVFYINREYAPGIVTLIGLHVDHPWPKSVDLSSLRCGNQPPVPFWCCCTRPTVPVRRAHSAHQF